MFTLVHKSEKNYNFSDSFGRFPTVTNSTSLFALPEAGNKELELAKRLTIVPTPCATSTTPLTETKSK